MAGFAPTFEGGMGIEGAVQTPLSPAAGSDLSAANSLLGLFASSGGSSSGRAPSANERNADLWMKTMGDTDIASASMDQLNQFQRQHPSAGSWAFDAAETMRNESLQARDQEISVEQKLDEAFLTSPVGIVASQNASSMEDSAAGQSYLANARAQFVANNFRMEELAREAKQGEANESRRTEMWTLSAFDMRAGAEVIKTAYVDAVAALVRDPTQTINFDEIEGLVENMPQLAGTVMTRENAPQVLQQVRDAYQENQTRRIAMSYGLQPGELGVMPDAVANSVFASIDATVVWSEGKLDPGEIRTRLENTMFNKMVEAGVPLDVISSISMATAGNALLQSAAMAAITEGTGAVLELYNSAEFVEARQANKNLASEERVRAFAGFSEMARVWGGTSSVASVYEEVNETERALKFGAATIAALDTVMVEAESQGTPASLGQNFYRQNLEQVATQFDAAIAANPSFKPEVVKHLTSDLNVQLQDINQTANDAGYKVSVGDNDKLIFIPTEEGLLGIQKVEAEIAALESGERGNPRDFRGTIEGYKDQLQELQTPPTMSLNDLQYKWTVLNGLGEVGSEVRTIASAEFGLELASDVGSDAREALTETAPQVQDVIASFEGFSSTAYWDVNAWRTGYGSDTVTLADGTVQKVTEDTVVTEEDAKRDLARRSVEFEGVAVRNVGQESWDRLPSNVKSALVSVAYNYGSLPSRIRTQVKSGDVEEIATAIEGLAGDNDGINRRRRLEEAAIVRGSYAPGVEQVSTTTLEPAPPAAEETLAPETSARPTARGGSSRAPETSARPTARPKAEDRADASSQAGSVPFEQALQSIDRVETTPAMLAELEALVARLKGKA